ncbi:uncharacterized protein A1O9_07203 [Exophiala aquamarina CBS 119918]|uniref:Uncharacterized protein n=1 Tax=Exophiala aquamarina CBS 119918 TaxID=1182545 RepID=A0A072PCI2_9EURO|nr:uncharacterized protein A1O9_07203 [Exophiala aquamarina CBS 119918]KEF57013.1 hypothetical protein A1O9_07203 [Exophiala aquamarina CBS 119918]
MGGRRWTAAEETAFRTATEQISKHPFESLDKFRSDVRSHMEASGLNEMSYNRVRGKFDKMGKAVGKTGGQYIQSLIDGATVVNDDRETVDRENRRPSFSVMTESSTLDPLNGASEHSPTLQRRENALNSTSPGAIDMELKEAYRYKVHEQPPLHETVKWRMRDILRDLNGGIDAFMVIRSVSTVGSDGLNTEAIALSELMFWNIPLNELATNLDNLFGGLGMTAKTTSYEDDFDNLPFPRPSHDLRATFLFGFLQPDTCKMVERGEKVHWLQNVVRPALLGHADDCRKNLFGVFVSLASPPGLQEQGISQAGANHLRTFENRKGHATIWEQRVTSAFHAALELRLELELSRDEYEYRFPSLGEPFEEEWMSAAHSMVGLILLGSKVYACLQPAIISVNRGNPDDDPVTVAKAIVMIEGYGPEV